MTSDAARALRPRCRREMLAVYPIVDLPTLRGARVEAEGLVAAVLRGGATMIQLRDKSERAGDLALVATRVRAACAEAGAPLVVNDRVDIAIAAGADGVHVGQRDRSAAEVRALADAGGRPDLIVGVSVRTIDEARRALADGADYLSVSPVFDTPTKMDAERGVGLDGVRALREAFPDAPLVAIGGIKASEVAAVIAAGADGVAFVSAMGAAPEDGVRAIASRSVT